MPAYDYNQLDAVATVIDKKCSPHTAAGEINGRKFGGVPLGSGTDVCGNMPVGSARTVHIWELNLGVGTYIPGPHTWIVRVFQEGTQDVTKTRYAHICAADPTGDSSPAGYGTLASSTETIIGDGVYSAELSVPAWVPPVDNCYIYIVWGVMTDKAGDPTISITNNQQHTIWLRATKRPTLGVLHKTGRLALAA